MPNEQNLAEALGFEPTSSNTADTVEYTVLVGRPDGTFSQYKHDDTKQGLKAFFSAILDDDELTQATIVGSDGGCVYIWRVSE